MSTESLCIGDNICLYSQEIDGYVFALQSSDVFTGVAVGTKQDKDRPLIPDPQVVSYAIHVANRYKQNKKLRKLLEKKDSQSYAYETAISHAKLSADAENEDNAVEQARQCGKKLLYGQVIQLQHSFTKKYIHASTTLTSRSESSNMLVELQAYNAKHSQFKVMPRYKVKAEGDVVFVEDQIVLESIKSPGQYLHVSRSPFPSQYVYSKYTCHELSLSVRQSGFMISRQSKPVKANENFLRAGRPIRLFHKEIEANLVAEGLFGEEKLTEEIHFRLRPVTQTNPKTLTPSTSAITYWQFELEDSSLEGGTILWEQQVRIRHMISRRYMKITKEGQVHMSDSNRDPLTVFRLHSVIKEQDTIEYETYCRIEHVVTGRWLSASAEIYKSQTDRNIASVGSNSMASLRWTQAHLVQVCTDEEMKYDDAFTVQMVEEEHVEIFNFMAGCVPFLQKLIEDRKAGLSLNAKQAHDYVCALDQMCKFMIVEGEPNKNRQKLLRNLRLVELLVELLKTPLRGSPDIVHLQKIFAKAYDVLYNYLKGDSRKNELYIAKHIDFFQEQFVLPGGIGLKSAQMTMELIKDNRKIVDRITHEHIDGFVELLSRKKNFQYLQLLNVLCVCDGMALPGNQEYITRAWLMSDRKNVVYRTDLGQKIGLQENEVYVSTDNGDSWIPLGKFVAQGETGNHGRERDESLESNQKFLFLTHQLDLFGKLCYGRNKFAIDVITKALSYLTWEEAYICLSSEKLPDDLRAKYCHLIIGMFVDIDDNVSVLDRIKLTFVYDDINDDADDEFRGKTPQSEVTLLYFPQIRDWISQFLDQNKDMTASLIGHNMLVEQVLRLVHYLVKYGYYGNTQDIKQLLRPLLDLLDGRNDKPFAKTAGKKPDGNAHDVVVKNYREGGRFKVSQEAKAIVDAKHQAMEVLDLFFNFRFNTRLEQFVYEFKRTHQMASSAHGAHPELGPLIYETFDFEEEGTVCRVALRRLGEIFEKSDYFKGDADIVAILMDLSDYQYDKMLVQSMALLNRYYSAHDTLFKRAVQAQVLITPRSVKVYGEVLEILPKLRRLAKAKLGDRQAEEMGEILDKLIVYCQLRDHPEEPHPMNQRILYNFNLLSDIFDILSKEIDVKLTEMYQGMKMVLQKSFKLLQAMAKGNEVIQARLYDRLDFLLAVKGAEQEMAEALTEIFTGNKVTCMKILAYQTQKIMQLAAEHGSEAPHFLELLSAIVKVEELNLPLKRNQGYVMKYFMQYRAEVAGSVDASQSDRMILLQTTTKHKELKYLLSMVDLLATCAEGENRFIESICQTIFSLPDLLQIITNDKINNGVKKPFLRFMLWVYMNTAGGIIESGAGDLNHDRLMWKFLVMIAADLDGLTNFIQDNQELVKKLLKKAPDLMSSSSPASSTAAPRAINLPAIQLDNEEVDDGNGNQVLLSSPSVSGEDVANFHGSLHFYFDAVMPALQVFFRTYYAPDNQGYPEEFGVVDRLSNKFIKLVEYLGPTLSSATHLKTMVTCVSSILSSSTVNVKVMEEFQSKYGNLSASSITSDARKEYVTRYSIEEELNDQLNVFAENFAAVYGGKNDIRTQMGFDSLEEYTVEEGNEELPLGQEFQNHMRVFVNPHANTMAGRLHKARKLIDQLAVSTKLALVNETDRIEQNRLDIKCLQLLRGFIHNEVVKLPNTGQNDPKLRKRQLQTIASVQAVLEDHSAILKTLPHLSKNSDLLIREILSFMAAMLYGGNVVVQRSMIDYFYGTREEKFFFAIKNRIDLSTIAIKEQRSLAAQYMAKVDEAVEMARSLKKAMVTAKSAAKEFTMSLLNANASQMGSNILLGSRLARGSGMLGAKTVMGVGAAPGGRARKGRKKRGGSRAGSYMSLQGSRQDLSKLNESDEQPLMNGSRNKKSKVAPANIMELQEVKVSTNPADLDREEIAEIEALAADEMDMEYKDEGYIELVLNVLGLMCDGQNADLQNYLREQPDNIKSFNLVGETARFLQLLYSNINPNTISLVIQLFNTLVEFCSGNAHNQMVAFDNKVIDYVNYILRNKQYKFCKAEDILDLQSAIEQLVKAMSEENRATKDVSKEVMSTLDMDSIHEVILTIYQKSKDPRLPENVRESNLHVAFGYYHLITRYQDVDDEFSISELRNRGTRIMKEYTQSDIDAAWDFYETGTMSVELLKDGQLQKVYFYVKDKTVLREEVKELFKYEVDRSSPTNKLREFLVWSRNIMQDIKYQKRILANPLFNFFVKGWYWFNMMILMLSFIIALLICISWVDPEVTGKYDNVTKYITDPGGFTRPEPGYWSELPTSTVSVIGDTSQSISIERLLTYVLGGLHNILSVFIFISFFLSNNPKLPSGSSFRKCCQRTLQGKSDHNDDDDEEIASELQIHFFSFKTFYYIVFLAMSILGTAFYGYFFAFHLLHITQNNQLLKRVILAVTRNGRSLLWVFILGLIVFYIYALILFALFRDINDSSAGLHCSRMYECFFALVHQGLILSTLEVFIEAEIADKDYSWHMGKWIFDMSFFIIITTIGLNIIFGIIVDTFSELRDSKWQIDQDMRTTCFICSRESYDFEHQPGGFERHVKHEHCQWAYLFFFIHLSDTNVNDYSSLELFVHRLLERDSINFFPLNRALSLEEEEDSNEQKMETLLFQVNYIMEKMKEQEANKVKEQEEKKQQEWAQKHAK